jgi:hypothetical protein
VSVNSEERKMKDIWIERFARFGLFAKGVVYIIIGALSVLSATGVRDLSQANQKGALDVVAAQPFGIVLLSVLAIGLIGYSLWRIIQAIKDPEHKKEGAKRFPMRAAYTVSAIVYASLAVAAIKIVIGAREEDNNSARDWTAQLLAQPFGRWLVALVALIVIGVGLYQFYRAYTAKFSKKLTARRMSANGRKWATRIGRLGMASRGVVFSLIGIFLMSAAWRFDSREAQGLDGALRALAARSHGAIILGTVATGLVAYGIYMFVEARYRRIYMV